jgi:hypothetical protein
MCTDECRQLGGPVEACVLAGRQLAAALSLRQGYQVAERCPPGCQDSAEAMYAECMGEEDDGCDWDADWSPVWKARLETTGCAGAVRAAPGGGAAVVLWAWLLLAVVLEPILRRVVGGRS